MSERKRPPSGHDDPSLGSRGAELDERDDELDAAADGVDGAGDEGLDALVEAIASSARPRAIDPDVHERILRDALGLGDEQASVEGALLEDGREPEPSELEVARAAALRRAFDAAAKTADLDALDGIEAPEVLRLVALARALRLAFAPTGVDTFTHERLLRPALSQPSRRGNARFLVGATTVLVAIAAVFAGLWYRAPQGAPTARLEAASARAMIPVRSTESLFSPLEPFPREGGATERIDKIERARAADLRNNRFAAWGIQ